jgi:hypothetical protein
LWGEAEEGGDELEAEEEVAGPEVGARVTASRVVFVVVVAVDAPSSCVRDRFMRGAAGPPSTTEALPVA